uniref:Uncharacterized protein n=1 Tax=Oncorhynchus tshawytscha TaxID=74940 RepID=A0A8C8K1E1_ONCTS
VDITEASVSGRKTRCDCVRRKSVTNGYIFATGSCKRSRLHFRNVMKYKAIIKKVGGKYEIDPAIICGIISRVPRWESNTGQEWLMLLQTVATTLKGEWGGTFDTSWTNQICGLCQEHFNLL